MVRFVRLCSLNGRQLVTTQCYLVESLCLQPLAQDFPDAGQICDGLLAHGLRHEVAMLLRGRRHLARSRTTSWRRLDWQWHGEHGPHDVDVSNLVKDR